MFLIWDCFFTGSRYNQSFDDDDDYGIEEVEEYGISSEPDELTSRVDKQYINITRVYESSPSIKFIQKEEFDLRNKLLFDTSRGPQVYVDGLFDATSKDTESLECVKITD